LNATEQPHPLIPLCLRRGGRPNFILRFIDRINISSPFPAQHRTERTRLAFVAGLHKQLLQSKSATQRKSNSYSQVWYIKKYWLSFITTFVSIVILCELCDHILLRKEGHYVHKDPQRALRI